MSQLQHNLFNFPAATPREGIAHGSALVRSDAEASAILRRGIDLSAGIRLEGRLAGELGRMVIGSLDARAEAGVGASLAAAFPLDLFDEAGLVARFRVQAAASASVQAAVSLELDVFQRLIREQFEPPLSDMLEIFLDEVRISAGVWGRAALSAELYGQAVLAGSLLPTAGREAGFSFSAEYGVGWGAGAGVEFAANFGIEDPQRLLGRLADATTRALLGEVDSYLASLPEPKTVAQAVAALRIMLPLATSSAFRLGLELTTAEDGAARERAAQSVARAFVAQAQVLLLEALVELGIHELAELLDAEDLPEPDQLLDSAQLGQLAEALLELRDLLLPTLDGVTSADPERWLLSILEVLEAVDGVLAFGALPQQVTADARQAMATFWAAGVLAHRVVTAARAFGEGNPFAATLPPAAYDGTTAAHVATALGRPGGSPLLLSDLVTFLLGDGPIDRLRQSVPWTAEVVEWLEEATGATSGELLERLLVDLADPGHTAIEDLLQFLGTSLNNALTEHVAPDLLEPMLAADPDNDALRVLVDELALPLLVSLPTVVLPNLPQVGTAEGRLRLREALSAILLQSLGQFVLGATDLLLHHGLDEAERQLRDIGRIVREAGEREPVFAAVAAVAAGSVLPVIPTPSEVDKVLQLCADIAAIIDDHEREPLMGLARTALAAGLGTEQTRTAALAVLSGSDAAPREETLQDLLDQALDGAWRAMEVVGPALLELVLGHLAAQVEMVAKAIEAGAKAIVAAAEKALEWVGTALSELEAELRRLVELGGRLLTDLMADVRALTSHLTGLVARVVRRIRDAVLEAIEPLIADFPDWAKEGLRTLLGLLFDAVGWVVTLPAQILGSVAGWVESILTSSLASAAHDEHAVREAVRNRITGAGAGNLEFDLSLEAFGQKIYDLGTVSFPGSAILGAVADVVSADPIFGATVRHGANRAVQLRANKTEQATIRGQIDATIDEAAAKAIAADLAPGKPLSIHIASPEALGLERGEAALTITVAGANHTFVKPVLGVPRRLRVQLNGHEFIFEPEHWTTQPDGGLRLKARVGLPLSPKEPGPPSVEIRPQRLTVASIERPTSVAVRLAEADELEFIRTRPIAGLDKNPRVTTATDSRASQVLSTTRLGAAMTSRAASAARIVARADRAAGEGTPRPVVGNGTARVSFAAADLGLAPTDHVVQHLTIKPIAEPAPTDADGQPLLPGQVGLNSVQVAVSDGKGRSASESVVFFLAEEAETAPPEDPPRRPGWVTPDVPRRPGGLHQRRPFISAIEFAPPGDDWRGEYVEIRSTGVTPANLEGWTLRDLALHTYTFPTFVLAPGRTVKVWTGPGDDDVENLHWGRRAAVWNNNGDVAILADASGREVDRHVYVP